MTALSTWRIRSKLAKILTTFTLLLAASANAAPIVDGFASAGEYSNMLSVQWYNDHNSDGTQFPSGGGQTTAVYTTGATQLATSISILKPHYPPRT